MESVPIRNEMMKAGKTKNYVLQYVINTYLLFVLLMIVLGGIATVLLHGTQLVMKWLISITAWTPTYVFLLMFKKLYPNSTIKDFYKNAFYEKLNIRLIVTMTIIQIFIFVLSVYMVSIQKVVITFRMLNLSYKVVIPALLFTLIQGPTGEETGWRGYLLPSIEKKFGVVKGSLMTSLIWAFWHAPIWFFETEYSGVALLKYIIVFVICITSLGFSISICYYHCNNLFIPIWMHFVFNLLGGTFIYSKFELVEWYAVFYFILALCSFIWYKNLQKSSIAGSCA